MTLIGFFCIVILTANAAFSGSWSTHPQSFDTVAQIGIAKPENPSFSKRSPTSPITYSEDEVDNPVDFSRPYVKAIISAGARLTRPNKVEKALINSLSDERSDVLHGVLQCPVCFGNLHYYTAITLKCGDAMHRKCYNGNTRANNKPRSCPVCWDEGPHVFIDRETFFTRALAQFEINKVIPRVSERKIRATMKDRSDREEAWKHGYETILGELFIETMKTICSHVSKILKFVISDVHKQMSPLSSRAVNLLSYIQKNTPNPTVFGKQVLGDKSPATTKREWILSNLKILVERMQGGLPLTRDTTSPLMALKHVSFRGKVVDYLKQLHNLFVSDFTAKIKAESTKDSQLFYRWMDRITNLKDFVSVALMLPSDQNRSEKIHTLFDEFISGLPFWTKYEGDMLQDVSIFESDELTEVLENVE